MKKSQIYNQIFIYILTIVIVGLILAFGYKSITNIQSKGCDICIVKLRNNLGNDVEGIISDFGSVQRKDIQMCCNFNQLCLVESVDAFPVPANANPIIKDSIKSNTGMNAFLLDEKSVQPFNIGRISTDPDVMCIKGTSISLKLEGKGNYVKISKWI